MRVVRRPFPLKKTCCIDKDQFPNRGQALGCGAKFFAIFTESDAIFRSNTTSYLHALGNREGTALRTLVDNACCGDFKKTWVSTKKWINFFSTVATCRDCKCPIPTGVKGAGSHCAFSSSRQLGFLFRVSRKHCSIRVLPELAGWTKNVWPKTFPWWFCSSLNEWRGFRNLLIQSGQGSILQMPIKFTKHRHMVQHLTECIYFSSQTAFDQLPCAFWSALNNMAGPT